MEEQIIEAIAAGKRPDFSGNEDEIVYDLCTEMFESRRITDATYKRALDTIGLQMLVELIAIMGYYCMVSVTFNAFEAPCLPESLRPSRINETACCQLNKSALVQSQPAINTLTNF